MCVCYSKFTVSVVNFNGSKKAIHYLNFVDKKRIFQLDALAFIRVA